MRARFSALGSGPLLLFALAGALGATSILLAVWGWRSSRQYEDQLARAARGQAEILARDFSEEVRALGARADEHLFGAIRFQPRWPAGTATTLRRTVREVMGCGCAHVIPETGGTFVWRSSEPDRIEIDGVAPERAEALRKRIAAVLLAPIGIGTDVIISKVDAYDREVAAPMLRVVRGDLRMAAGYIGTSRGYADSVLTVAARTVQANRFGERAPRLVSWRVVSPAGTVVLREGPFTPSGVGVSVAFLRARFQADTGAAGPQFLASARPVLDSPPADVRDTILDPVANPYRLIVQVDPAALGEVLYGSARGPVVPIIILLALSLVLTVATLFIAMRMVSNLREREAFATAVAHDLRTPLTQILLYGESLQLDRPAVQTQKDAARVIVREARRLIHLVENALHFVRGGRARPALDLTPLRLGPLIEEIVAGLRPVFERAGVDARTVIAADAEVIGDRDAIARVLTNLLDNAVRFGPRGQTVTVALGADPDGRVRLEVSDQGPGIPHHLAEEVVKPFVRGGRSPGTGIGLAVSKQLVELMEGALRVEEAPGGGARLVVLLPRSSPIDAPQPVTSEVLA